MSVKIPTRLKAWLLVCQSLRKECEKERWRLTGLRGDPDELRFVGVFMSMGSLWKRDIPQISIPDEIVSWHDRFEWAWSFREMEFSQLVQIAARTMPRIYPLEVLAIAERLRNHGLIFPDGNVHVLVSNRVIRSEEIRDREIQSEVVLLREIAADPKRVRASVKIHGIHNRSR